MKALITGVGGQDGSYLAEFLLDKGYDVIGVTRRSATASMWRLENSLKSPHFKLIEGDVTDMTSCFNFLISYKPDEIYNLAAQSNVGTSFQQPATTWESTAKGVLNLLETIRLTNLTCKFYQASSSEMFGYNYDIREREDANGMFEQGFWHNIYHCYQNEHTKFSPRSPYAIAKLAAHNLVKLYRESYGIFAVGGILFNHESPRRGLGFVTRKITNHFYNLNRGLNKGKLKLGNIEAYRDWGYAKEYVEAMWLMLQNPKPTDYVIGTGETHTVKEFLQEVINITANGYSIEELVDIDDSCKRPAEVPYLRADASLAAKELQWTPKTKFKDLVKIMVDNESDRI
jgi:GDPmannose 4,6-dehydratase